MILRDDTYEMNIWSVRTDEWHRSRMKCDASRRHSEGYFLDVKPMMTGIPLSQAVSDNHNKMEYEHTQ